MGTYRIDSSLWPIVIHSVNGSLTDRQIDEYVKEGTELLLRGEPHVVVMDIRGFARVSAYARARNAAWQRAYRTELQSCCLGTAYVLSSALMRFITMTVLLLGQLPTPYLVCETMEEALAWARERLAEPPRAIQP